MPGYNRGLWRGAQVPLTPPTVLVEAEDGGAGGKVIQNTLRRERGVTQGVPLLPTILNMVVDVVVNHWEFLLVAERE